MHMKLNNIWALCLVLYTWYVARNISLVVFYFARNISLVVFSWVLQLLSCPRADWHLKGYFNSIQNSYDFNFHSFLSFERSSCFTSPFSFLGRLLLLQISVEPCSLIWARSLSLGTCKSMCTSICAKTADLKVATVFLIGRVLKNGCHMWLCSVRRFSIVIRNLWQKHTIVELINTSLYFTTLQRFKCATLFHLLQSSVLECAKAFNLLVFVVFEIAFVYRNFNNLQLSGTLSAGIGSLTGLTYL